MSVVGFFIPSPGNSDDLLTYTCVRHRLLRQVDTAKDMCELYLDSLLATRPAMLKLIDSKEILSPVQNGETSAINQIS